MVKEQTGAEKKREVKIEYLCDNGELWLFLSPCTKNHIRFLIKSNKKFKCVKVHSKSVNNGRSCKSLNHDDIP